MAYTMYDVGMEKLSNALFVLALAVTVVFLIVGGRWFSLAYPAGMVIAVVAYVLAVHADSKQGKEKK